MSIVLFYKGHMQILDGEGSGPAREILEETQPAATCLTQGQDPGSRLDAGLPCCSIRSSFCSLKKTLEV